MRVFRKASSGTDVFSLFLLKLIFIFFFTVMMVADFSTTPDLSENPEKKNKIWASLQDYFSQLGKSFSLKQSLDKIEGKILKGDTIINILTREGVEYQIAFKLFQDVKEVYNLKRIHSGQNYSLFLYKGDIKKFIYEVNYNRYINIVRNTAGDFIGKIVDIPVQSKKEIIRGEIRDTLFFSIIDLGEKAELADMLASLYEYDIDFNRDIRNHDRFSIIVEKKYLSGKFIRYGNILAAKFTNQGKLIRVLRYTDPEGKTAYYHPDGRAVKKMFLRCPLPFMRVTSGYGFRRHPVLGFSARHTGVDFAAPQGTPVRATASGSVIKTGYDRIRGRYIIIRHPNRYISHYYHLRGIKKEIRSGSRVEQAQVIGFVGKSGRATGSHLHYGLQKNGRFINSLLLKSPTKNPVKKAYLEGFRKYAAKTFFIVSNSKIIKISYKLRNALLGCSDTGMLGF